MKLFRRHREAATELTPQPKHALPPNAAPRWTPETAAEAGRRSGEVRRQKKEVQQVRTATIERVLDQFDKRLLGPQTLEATLILTEAVVAGDIKVPQDARERKTLAETAEVLHRIGRLETGQSTANVAHAGALSDEERAARVVAASERLAVLRAVELPAVGE